MIICISLTSSFCGTGKSKNQKAFHFEVILEFHFGASNNPFLTRVNELDDSFNKGILEHDSSSNIADSHGSHEQPKSQLAVHASRYSDFYKSHDGGNMITRNLEQLIIPQPSVPHRGSTERGTEHLEQLIIPQPSVPHRERHREACFSCKFTPKLLFNCG